MKIDTKEYTSNEALSRIQKLTEQKKFLAYIMEKGEYKYAECNNAVCVVGKNVSMRSQPNTRAKVIAKTNTKTTTYLTYLGEWKHPNKSDKWVCVKNSSGEVGWILRKYIQFIPNKKFKDIISQIMGRLITKKNTSKAMIKSVIIGTSLKIISIENYLNQTLKRYCIWGLIIWVLTFFITFSLLEWEVDFDHILKFIFWSVITIAAVLVAYHVVWKMIILPILKFIGLIIGGIIALFFFGEYLEKEI